MLSIVLLVTLAAIGSFAQLPGSGLARPPPRRAADATSNADALHRQRQQRLLAEIERNRKRVS